jgi:hypothetical protein
MINFNHQETLDYGDIEDQTKTALTAWYQVQQPAFEAFADLNGRIIDQVSRANTEWINFIGRRLDEDMAASRRLLECRTMADVFKTYTEFFQRAQQQYHSEFQYFTRLNQSMAQETAQAMRAHVSPEYVNGRHH